MNKLTPYIMFDGNCEEALNFYAKCFQGEITFMGKFKDSPMDVSSKDENKIMHATLEFWGGSIMASDHIATADFTSFSPSSNIHMSLSFDKLEDLETTFELLAEEGNIAMPINKTFWGDIFGMVKDKYGTQWMMSFREEKQA